MSAPETTPIAATKQFIEMPSMSFEAFEAEADVESLFAQIAVLIEEEPPADSLSDAAWAIPMVKMGREYKGAKSVEHLELLRTSNPDYGSLAPRTDRPNGAEVSYDPLTRFNVLGNVEREPRGAKSAAHLEILRTSNPCYGSLAPRTDRPTCAEVSYDPLTRFNVLGNVEREPRGAKSAAHLEILRTSNPDYSSLRPSIFKMLPLVDANSEHSTLEQLRMLRAAGTAGHVSLEVGGWNLQAKKMSNLDSFDELDEYSDEDEASSESGDGVTELRQIEMRQDHLAALRARRSGTRDSNTSDSSELSNAHTMERASNNSDTSLLEDDFPELAVPYSRKKRVSGDFDIGCATKADAKMAAKPAAEAHQMTRPHVVH